MTTITGKIDHLTSELKWILEAFLPKYKGHKYGLTVHTKNMFEFELHDSRLDDIENFRTWVVRVSVESKDGKLKYRIMSDRINGRHIKKFRNSDLNITVFSSSQKNVVKELIQYAYPLTYDELKTRTKTIPDQIIRAWKGENYGVKSALDLKIGLAYLVEDLKNYAVTGIPYQKIPAAQELLQSQDKMSKLADYFFRQNLTFPNQFVYVTPDGAVQTTYDSDLADNKDVAPEVMERVAILKMVENNCFVPDVGVRIHSDMFYVY
jgi:hypothetical protein